MEKNSRFFMKIKKGRKLHLYPQKSKGYWMKFMRQKFIVKAWLEFKRKNFHLCSFKLYFFRNIENLFRNWFFCLIPSWKLSHQKCFSLPLKRRLFEEN
jgi:hypothetical protein